MLSNRSNTLGGEGCPAADITKPARNRNILGVFRDQAQQPRAGSIRTVQEHAGSVGTRLTRKTEFMFRVCSLLVVLILAGCDAPGDAARKAKWDGAVVVRICRDGSYIYRLRNGEFWTAWPNQRVESPETVCTN